ncbi:MAG: hypothetical protein AAB426_15340 [Myxococcota bacterium]
MTDKIDAVKLDPVQAPSAAPIAEHAQVASEKDAPRGVVGMGSTKVASAVGGVVNAALQLDAPGAKRGATAPEGNEVVAYGLLGNDPSLPFDARIDRLAELASMTGALSGGLNHEVYQREFINLLWSTPTAPLLHYRGEWVNPRMAVAQELANRSVTHGALIPTTDFIDAIAELHLDGAEWSSFSYFMHSYLGGRALYDDPGIYFDRTYNIWRSPTWWFDYRPYDTYDPGWYWRYDLPYGVPDYYHRHYYDYRPSIIIDLGGRGRYHYSDPPHRPRKDGHTSNPYGGGSHNPYPRNDGARSKDGHTSNPYGGGSYKPNPRNDGARSKDGHSSNPYGGGSSSSSSRSSGRSSNTYGGGSSSSSSRSSGRSSNPYGGGSSSGSSRSHGGGSSSSGSSRSSGGTKNPYGR